MFYENNPPRQTVSDTPQRGESLVMVGFP